MHTYSILTSSVYDYKCTHHSFSRSLGWIATNFISNQEATNGLHINNSNNNECISLKCDSIRMTIGSCLSTPCDTKVALLVGTINTIGNLNPSEGNEIEKLTMKK